MRRIALCLTVLYACAAGASAQAAAPHLRGSWSLGITVGVSSFSAGTEGEDAEGQRIQFSPYRPTMWGVAAAYGCEGRRIGVAAQYGEAGLAARGAARDDGSGSGGLVVTEDAYHLTSFSLFASDRLLRLRGGPALRPALGVQLERWTGAGAPSRTVLGGYGGLAVEVLLTNSVVGTLSGELGFVPASPFRREDLPEGFDQRSTWRRTLAFGVAWRF